MRNFAFLTALCLVSPAGLAGPATGASTAPTTQPDPFALPGPVSAGLALYVGDELLKDYRPVSALVTPHTQVERPKFPAIDIHCHWAYAQSPASLLAAMDSLGIQKAINLSGGYGPELEQMLRRFHAAAPDRLQIFANIDVAKIDSPTFSQDTIAGLERAKALGAAGLKIFKTLGLTDKDAAGRLIPVDDARLAPVFEACGRLKLPVLIHSGDPTAFFQPIDNHNERWLQLKRHPGWSFYGPGFPTYDEVMAEHLRMIAAHPNTVFISAHLVNSGENLGRLSEWLDTHQNLYTDLSGRVPELGRQPYSARKFLIKYQDRVLFGTDRYPGRPDQPREKIYYRFLETEDEYFDYYDNPFPTEGEWKIYGLGLPDKVLEKIYNLNATRALQSLPPLATRQ